MTTSACAFSAGACTCGAGDELKETLELTGKYSSIRDFKLKVLDKAMTDINTSSDLGAKYKAVKTGRKITHIEFNFWVKDKKQARQQSKEGKKVTYTKADLDKNSALALPGESYEQALKRLNAKQH